MQIAFISVTVLALIETLWNVKNLRAPRKLTEEQRAELVERGKNMSKWKVTDVEETPDFDFDDEDEEILDGEDKIGF